jgi:L-ascorbate metabolism protein UlaG (beta-lactamase superfamily)
MEIRWYGHSAFLVTGAEHRVAIDPFGKAVAGLAARGIQFDYPKIKGMKADVLLITHEHGDHNGDDAVKGQPIVVRSTAGTIDTPIGPITAVASEHDAVAGTQRGPNTIFRFELDTLRLCHLGDFGQSALRPEQLEAIGGVEVLFVPVGGGPTVGGEQAAEVVRTLAPRLVVPMHYRTPAVDFLEPPGEFLDALGARVARIEKSKAEVEPLLGGRDDPTVVLLTPPH